MYINETLHISKRSKVISLRSMIALLVLLMANQIFAGLNVMAPLTINNEEEWQQFERRLSDLKANGVTSISTDVWWGAVELEQSTFDWKYYDRLSNLIEKAGLNWVPIMSFHQCGGNVGDNCNIPLPKWVWEYAKGKSIPSYFSGSDFTTLEQDDVKYVSELGKINSEYPSVWSTPLMKKLYVDFVSAFAKQYGDKSHMIEELNISLGPAGELRYPAYNAHDQYYPDSPAMFPRRGTFQGNSSLAKKSYQDYLRSIYSNSIHNFNQATSSAYKSFDQIEPITHEAINQIENEGFKDSPMNPNRHVFDWYHQSLLKHGETILEAIDTSKKSGPLASTPIGIKIPGIHWNMGEDFGAGNGFKWSHRLTEANAGLVSLADQTLYDPSKGSGYKSLLSHLKSVEDDVSSSFIVHFTCLEMGNNENAHLNADSMAKNLVHWFGAEAKRNRLSVKGENALEGSLYSSNSWFNIKDAITHAGYDGITILRMGELTDNHDVLKHLKELSTLIKNQAPVSTCAESMKALIK